MAGGQQYLPGSVFRNPGSMGHMWVVIGLKENDRLMTNWSTKRPGSDTTCLLVPGDHPRITHDSVIKYEFIKEISLVDLHQLITDNNLQPDKDIPVEVLERIQAGIFLSRKVPPRIKSRYAHLRKQ